MERLKDLLDAIDVTYSEMFFDSEEGVTGLGSSLFVSCSRVYFTNV